MDCLILGVIRFTFFYFLLVPCLFAQPWIENLAPEKRSNFFEIQRAAEFYFQSTSRTKGDGFKPYKRWEYYWRHRIHPDGSFPNLSEHLAEWFYYQKSLKRQRYKNSNTGSWKPLGPITSPRPLGGLAGIGRINCIAFHPNNHQIVYIGTPAGGVWRSRDGGATWASLTDTLPVLGVSDIAFNPKNPEEIYIATGDHIVGRWATEVPSIGIWKSEKGGNNWQPTALRFFVSRKVSITRILVNPQNPNIMLAGTSEGLFRTSDGGQSWQDVLEGVIHDLEFHPLNPLIVYASCIIDGVGTIYKSTNGGVTWVERARGLNKSSIRRVELAVTKASPNSVYAVCADARNTAFGGFYVSRDGGQNWILQSNYPNILDFSDDGSTDRGQAWYDLSIAVSPIDSHLVFVGGINIWRSMDSGKSWQIVSFWSRGGAKYVHADHHALEFIPNTNIIWSGNDGGIFISNNLGESWEMKNQNLEITQYYKIGTSEINPFFILGGSQDNGTHRFFNAEWSKILGGDGMDCLIDYSDPSIVFASIQNGEFFRSKDYGLSLQPIGRPGGEIGAWVSPIVQHPTNPNVVYIGLDNLWRSNDKGLTWSKVSIRRPFLNTKIRTIVIAPSAPHIIYLAPEGEMDILKSTDGGKTFRSVFNNLPSAWVNNILVHPQDSNRVWVCLGGYRSRMKVFESRNGGQTWSNISGSLPNLPANCLAYQQWSKEGLYLGMDVGVYYRDSTMQDWVLYNENLPNTIIYDLEINYATQSIRAATFGRGVWEAPLYEPSGVESCNRQFTLTEPSGFIEDGSGPLPYANLSDCRWLIVPRGAEGRRIKLQVLEMATEEGKDFLQIYDGDNLQAPLIGMFSGKRLPPVVRSSGEKMLVRFTSDDQNVDAGFRAFYQVEAPIGMQDELEKCGITLYPNPFEGQFYIQFAEPQAFNLRLYNSLGQLFWENSYEPVLRSSIQVPTTLVAGVYYLQILTKSKSFIIKLINKGS